MTPQKNLMESKVTGQKPASITRMAESTRIFMGVAVTVYTLPVNCLFLGKSGKQLQVFLNNKIASVINESPGLEFINEPIQVSCIRTNTRTYFLTFKNRKQ